MMDFPASHAADCQRVSWCFFVEKKCLTSNWLQKGIQPAIACIQCIQPTKTEDISISEMFGYGHLSNVDGNQSVIETSRA